TSQTPDGIENGIWRTAVVRVRGEFDPPRLHQFPASISASLIRAKKINNLPAERSRRPLPPAGDPYWQARRGSSRAPASSPDRAEEQALERQCIGCRRIPPRGADNEDTPDLVVLPDERRAYPLSRIVGQRADDAKRRVPGGRRGRPGHGERHVALDRRHPGVGVGGQG